ncbi:hypothetical protein P5P86_13440 [Nocardioides sp. BP30]|uniref:hypothetical protein n=1 Tax=Nocardioides sp. BP30 TaxID=3036374 RepID=UPI002468F3E7|nr:hypothetical protein [Nocardioides sp. BP30]WGL50965.1 hypothetical protein P5P86_13440 [Nocardioides sp. BP30]
MHRTIRRTRLAGVAGLASVALISLGALSACGSSGSDKASDPQHSDTASAAQTVAPGSTVEAVDAKSLMTAAAASMTSMKVSADMALGSSGAIHMSGVEQTRPSLLGEFSVNAAGQKLSMRMIGTRYYIQVPPSAGLPGGKKWVTMDVKELGSLTGMDTSSLTGALQDPASSLDKYSKYISGGTYVGEEKVDGVSTKHYDFTIDAKSAMAQMMPSGTPSGVTLPDAMKESVWIDAENRPVQMKTDMGSLGTVEMHLSDFGTKVSVAAPPADQVQDMAKLLSGAGTS